MVHTLAIATGLSLALAGCSSGAQTDLPDNPAVKPQVVQVENIVYKVGTKGEVNLVAGNGQMKYGSRAEASEPAKWETFGLITNDIKVGGQEHMECAAAVRNELTVPEQWSNSPANLIAMMESTKISGISEDTQEAWRWSGAKIDRSWVDADFDAAFDYAQGIVEYVVSKMDENGVYTYEVDGKTYTYKRLDTDLQWGCPVGTQLGEYGREFADEKREKGNLVTYIVTKDIFIEGSFVSGNVYAPGHTITMRNGGTITGQVICDRFVVDCSWACEIHDPTAGMIKTPDPRPATEPAPEPAPGPEPKPEQPTEPSLGDLVVVNIPLDIKHEYIVQPDDFAIHNGDLLYENIANGDLDPSYQTATSNRWVVVTAGEIPMITIDNVDEMYKEYLAKPEPYVSEDGIFTLEVYIWPGKKVVDAEGNEVVAPLDYSELGFASLEQAVEGRYLKGDALHPAVISEPNDAYEVSVSEFMAIQGHADTPYVHVTIHIRPNQKAE